MVPTDYVKRLALGLVQFIFLPLDEKRIVRSERSAFEIRYRIRLCGASACALCLLGTQYNCMPPYCVHNTPYRHRPAVRGRRETESRTLERVTRGWGVSCDLLTCSCTHDSTRLGPCRMSVALSSPCAGLARADDVRTSTSVSTGRRLGRVDCRNSTCYCVRTALPGTECKARWRMNLTSRVNVLRSSGLHPAPRSRGVSLSVAPRAEPGAEPRAGAGAGGGSAMGSAHAA